MRIINPDELQGYALFGMVYIADSSLRSFCISLALKYTKSTLSEWGPSRLHLGSCRVHTTGDRAKVSEFRTFVRVAI